MINKNTGFIELAPDKVIKPTLTLMEVKAMNLGEVNEERNMNFGWIWFDTKDVKVADQYFMISFCFYNEKLTQLSLRFSDSKYDPNKGWESWSEAGERQKGETFSKWLNAEVGSERNFKWGEVWAGYDSKGGFSSVEIRYKY